MPSNLMQYKVFLAWTSNLQKEKEKFEDVLNSFSREREEQYYQSFRAVHSSQIPSSFGRPQDVINEKIKLCDYAVFVLYDNLGSPAGGESEKTGIEEEWDFVKQLKQNRKIRDIALFFKKLETDKEKDPGDKLKKLLSFRDRIKKEVFFDEYSTLEDFGNKLRMCLREWADSSIQNNKDENSFQSLSEFSTSPQECQSDNGKKPPSFYYWTQKVNQLLECGVKKQNSALSLFPEEYTNALFCAKEALETAGSEVEKAQAWNSVGQTQFFLRNYQEAIECCEKIISQFGEENELPLPLKQQVAIALVNKGVALAQLLGWEELVKSCDDVIGKFSKETDLFLREQVAKALVNKGIALFQDKHEMEAIGVYDEVIRRFGEENELPLPLKQQVAKALVNKGIALSRLGYWKESRDVFEEVIRRFEGVQSTNIQEIVTEVRKQLKCD
ncbi:MAG: hypothetical protein J6P38_06025 [Acetobacter sp.]|nr:hypothetical protein [Acetobacter sp.]